MKNIKRRVGYIRVSSVEQNISRQVNELSKLKITEIVIDKANGSVINYNLNLLINELVSGDELVVLSLDRLGRSLRNNVDIIEKLKSKGVRFRSIKENLIIDINNEDPMNDFTYSIFSAVAQLEKSLIKERQEQGIRSRKQRLGKAYNKQAEHKIKMLRNKAFRNDIKIKTRDYVMEKWDIKKSCYYSYRKLIKK